MRSTILFIISASLLLCFSCAEKIVSESYDPEGSTDTRSKEVSFQLRKIWRMDDGGLSVSNDFTSARLNDFVQVNDTLYSAIIAPENAPINKSPWYAFKIWSHQPRTVYIQMEYQQGYAHRYYPDFSTDMVAWQPMDSSLVQYDSVSNITTIKLKTGPAPVYIAGQEIMTSDYVYAYIDSLKNHSFVRSENIGFSALGKPLPVVKIGNENSEKVIVVLGRQHPPEATGFLALQAFIDKIIQNESLSNTYRQQYLTVLIPMINPDGVDLGHWRHNSNGIDLNRDWHSFNQPETSAVRDYFSAWLKNEKKQILFVIDFHSTQEDLFYVFAPDRPTLLTGFTHRWLDGIEASLGDYTADRIPTSGNSPVSTRWFHETYSSEAVTYEVGDDSPRPRIKAIGEAAAVSLMEHLPEQ